METISERSLGVYKVFQKWYKKRNYDIYFIDMDTTSERPLGMYKNVNYRYGNHKWETIRQYYHADNTGIKYTIMMST